MKANKHEINGYIYVTSEEKPIRDEYYVGFYKKSIFVKKRTSGILIANPCKKIILCNNPNLPIQQLTTEEVEYLKSVDSFEVEIGYLGMGGFVKTNEIISKDKVFYKIIIPQETEQTKESIEEVANKIYHNIKHKYPVLPNDTTWIQGFIEGAKWKHQNGYNHAKQTLYTEDEMIDFVEEYKEFSINSNKDVISFKEWFNKHKKQ